MDYAALEQKLSYYQKHKHLIPKEVTQNYEASFRVEYTHNSTAIEGNTLSLMETKLLLEDGISPGGKNLREIYEAVNHSKAFGYVAQCVAESKTLDKYIVKDIHAILMDNIITGGIYRNVDVYITGARHTPPSPTEAFQQLEAFYADMLSNQSNMHSIDFAAWTHAEFVKIHPFVDGNGRTSRLLMNYQLTAAGYLPVSIPQARRLEYFETLEAYACDGDLSPFAALIGGLEDARLGQYIKAIEQTKAAAQAAKSSDAGLKGSLLQQLDDSKAKVDGSRQTDVGRENKQDIDL